jgi:hypothetical protein
VPCVVALAGWGPKHVQFRDVPEVRVPVLEEPALRVVVRRGRRLLFPGPFLVRRELEYSVARLAHGRATLLGSARHKLDWQESLRHLKDRIRSAFEQMDPKR